MNLTNKATAGVKWTTISTLVKAIIQIVRLSILTFLLEKQDFGVIAIAMMVINFTEIFANLGLTIGIIHNQHVTLKQYSTLYWLNILSSLFIFSLLWLCTPLLVSFYNEPILQRIIPLLGFQIVLNSFGKIYQTIKTKELDFRFISIVSIWSVLIGLAVTILLAYFNFGVYSLVYGQLIQVILNQSAYLISGRKEQKIKFYMSLKEVKSFLNIGGFQLASQILDFISSRIDVFLIGKFFGMELLGVYNIAKELILKPYQLVNSLIIGVFSSAFSKIQHDFQKVKVNFARVIRYTAIISMPIYALVFVFADLVVAILYSKEFSSVSLFLRLLVFLGVGSAISSLSSILIIAKGRTDIGFRWTIIRVCVSTLAIFFTYKFGINIVAITQSIISIMFIFIFWRMAALPLSGLSLKEYIASFFEPLFVAFVLGCGGTIINNYFNLSVFEMILLALVFCILFVMYYILFNRKIAKEIKQLILK